MPGVNGVGMLPAHSENGLYASTMTNAAVDTKLLLTDIRGTLQEQLKCLDGRTDMEAGMLCEMQDFFRRRAEVEMDYAKNLDKLVKNAMLKHKQEKHKREHWPLFSMYQSWQAVLNSTKQLGKDHMVLSEVYSNHINNRFTQSIDDLQRIYKRCREIGTESHEELLKVLNELHMEMKTYHLYHGESTNAEGKLRQVENQRQKIMDNHSNKEKLLQSKKYRSIERECDKRQSKFQENKLKALKARNNYILSMEGANSAIHKYFVDDLSDLIDCVDLGLHNSVSRALMQHMSAEQCMKLSLQQSVDDMNRCIANLDARADKQRFLEVNNSAFMLPNKFEFQPHKGDEVTQFSAQKPVQEELDQRYQQLSHRLTCLKTENDEIWKTLEATEKTLVEMVNAVDFDVADKFDHDNRKKSPDEPGTVIMKRKGDRLETEYFYLKKFREYTLSSNLIRRLQAKHDLIQKHLGSSAVAESPTSLQGNPFLLHRPPSLPPKPKKKRIGRIPTIGHQPRLFGGSLEEYVEATGEEIPTILQHGVKIIQMFGLHHQGIFRVSGSQVEILQFKEAFEKGEDPFLEMTDCSDMNSVAGVMKLYLRELREPLFPIQMFDQFINSSRAESVVEFIEKVQDLVVALPRPVFVVLRYLFAFLNHLSEYSDENMMDPYNLAICFGPTLLPIPEDRDQVQYQNNVNELVKNIITYQDEIFANSEVGGPLYEKYLINDEIDDDQVTPEDGANSEDIDDDSELGYCASEEESEVCDAVATYDFEGRSERELTFLKGDPIQLHSKVSADWWKGSVEGKEGLIPDKYIHVKSASSMSALNDDGIERKNSLRGSSRGALKKQQRNHSNSSSSSGRSSDDLLPPPPIKLPEISISGVKHQRRVSAGDVTSDDCLKRSSLRSTASDVCAPSRVEHKLRGSESAGSNDSMSPASNKRESALGMLRCVSGSQENIETVPAQQTNVPKNARNANNSNENLAHDIESTMAEVMSGLESLGVESGKVKDVPNKSTSLPSGRPDLVRDLPQQSENSPPSPKSDAERMSPELTVTDAFAQTNQDTLKKAGMSASVHGLPSTFNKDVPVTHFEQRKVVPQRPVSELMSIFKQEQNKPPISVNSKSNLERHRPLVKVKPSILKKPAASPEMLRKSSPHPSRKAYDKELKEAVRANKEKDESDSSQVRISDV